MITSKQKENVVSRRGKAVGETGDGAYLGYLPGGRWEIEKN